MNNISTQDLAQITSAIVAGFTPVGVAIDVVELAQAAYNLYKDKNDDNYFEVALCIIAFIPGAGDGIKIGFRLVDKKPEILFDLLRFIINEYNEINPNKPIYGDPEQWLNDILDISNIKKNLADAKREAFEATKKEISSDFLRYFIDASIEKSFDFLESSISIIISVMIRKVISWKRKVPKTSANTVSPSSNKTINNQGTGYSGNTSRDGSPQGTISRAVSRSDIVNTLKNAGMGAVGEHMADYWIANQLGLLRETLIVHDKGQLCDRKLPKKRKRMLQLKIDGGVNDTGIDAIWETRKKTLQNDNNQIITKTYAIIEVKTSVNTIYLSYLGDLDADADQRARRKQPNPQKVFKPRKKTLVNQQMSVDWVSKRLKQYELHKIVKEYSRHVLAFSSFTPSVYKHMSLLVTGEQVKEEEHREHQPSKVWSDKEIDTYLNKRVDDANTKNGY